LPLGYGGPAMRSEAIPREVNRNYEASKPVRVWPQYREMHTLITVIELRAFYKMFGIVARRALTAALTFRAIGMSGAPIIAWRHPVTATPYSTTALNHVQDSRLRI